MTADEITPARYFPVSERPLRMKAGLLPFGTDLGNGSVDAQFFQVDGERARYLANKAHLRRLGERAGLRHQVVPFPNGSRHAVAHQVISAWIRETIDREHPGLLDARGVAGAAAHAGSREPYEDLYDALWSVQEDAAVVVLDEHGGDQTTMMSVHAPSGWAPERLVGASFSEIHRPVPDFADDRRAASSMVRAMVERGPYVRFVWTVSADPHLDHHPVHGQRASWPSPDETASWGYLRIERQVTVPFISARAALFLIRTHLYPFASLDAGQRETLRIALEGMPEPVATYKGLSPHLPHVLACLARSPAAR